MTDILLAGVAAIAGAIAAVAGFGIGSLLTPAVALSTGTKIAVALVALPHAVGTAVRLWALRDAVDRDVLVRFGLASAAGGLLGAWAHAALTSYWLTIALGAVLILSGTIEMLGLGRGLRLPAPVAFVAGVLSGFFGGLVGNQGGIRAAALLRFDLPPRTLVATATASAILVDLVRVPVYLAVSGAEIAANGPLVAVLTAGVVVGTLAGASLLRRIPRERFRRLLGALLVVLGVALIMGTALPRAAA